jgi:hypothetical protein
MLEISTSLCIGLVVPLVLIFNLFSKLGSCHLIVLVPWIVVIQWVPFKGIVVLYYYIEIQFRRKIKEPLNWVPDGRIHVQKGQHISLPMGFNIRFISYIVLSWIPRNQCHPCSMCLFLVLSFRKSMSPLLVFKGNLSCSIVVRWKLKGTLALS